MYTKLTKINCFIISLVGLLVHVISRFSVDIGICRTYASKCTDATYLFTIYSLIFVAIFIFSVITLKLKDSTFTSWRKFSLWAVPISLLIISIFPTNTHGMDFLPIVKGTVSIALASIYSVISLILIISRSLEKGPQDVSN